MGAQEIPWELNEREGPVDLEGSLEEEGELGLEKRVGFGERERKQVDRDSQSSNSLTADRPATGLSLSLQLLTFSAFMAVGSVVLARV